MHHEGVEYGSRQPDGTWLGVWAIISELGTADILAIARDPSVQHEHGPQDNTVWKTLTSSRAYEVNDKIHVYDAFGIAAFVRDATIVIGDNITTLNTRNAIRVSIY